ncbi:MAG: tRNA (guanosine(37)-N1)-methyltransferase TrmD [Pseudomonadota bacterium]
MRFDVATLFPAIFDSFLAESLIGKGLAAEAFQVRIIDIRDFALDKHHTADDRPFGGGPGMVLKPEPLAGAIEFALAGTVDRSRTKVVLLTPAGAPLTQAKVGEYSDLDQLVLVCGRYEGVDERVNRLFIDEEISVGDYVLSGGEVPAMVLIEAVARLLPGVLGKSESVEEETFSQGLLEYPQYTRPRVFRGLAVPETLLSGDHAAIRTWRLRESLRRTLLGRPEMLKRVCLTPEQTKVLRGIRLEHDEFKLAFPDDED